jgi:hypothetical protein
VAAPRGIKEVPRPSELFPSSPSRTEAMCGNHFLQADLRIPISMCDRLAIVREQTHAPERGREERLNYAAGAADGMRAVLPNPRVPHVQNRT